jgi:hypothetical protein
LKILIYKIDITKTGVIIYSVFTSTHTKNRILKEYERLVEDYDKGNI